MAGFSTYAAQAVLNLFTGRVGIATPVAYIGLFTVAPTDAGGGTEVTGGSYARVSTSPATWNPPTGSGPSTITNGQVITFAASTAAWGNITSAALFDAPSGGNLLMWDYMGAFSWLPFTGTAANPCVVTSPNHGYLNGNVVVPTSEFGGTLPTGLGSGSGLVVSSVTTDTFAVNAVTTTTGDGMIRKLVPQVVGSGQVVSFVVGQLTFTAS